MSAHGTYWHHQQTWTGDGIKFHYSVSWTRVVFLGAAHSRICLISSCGSSCFRQPYDGRPLPSAQEAVQYSIRCCMRRRRRLLYCTCLWFRCSSSNPKDNSKIESYGEREILSKGTSSIPQNRSTRPIYVTHSRVLVVFGLFHSC